MKELCTLWNVEKTHTTPYHPQSNGIVERNNRGLGDSLRALLLDKGQDEWDVLLPHLMRAFRSTPHSATGETPNFMMMGREMRLPDQLLYANEGTEETPHQEYAQELQERLTRAHELLRETQREIRTSDDEEPPLFGVGDLVWLENKRRRKGENPKLQPKFVGPFEVLETRANHTYVIERQGQQSVQNERRLKLYRPCEEQMGQGPARGEVRRRPNMKGVARSGPRPSPVERESVVLPSPTPVELRPEPVAVEVPRETVRDRPEVIDPPEQRIKEKEAEPPAVQPRGDSPTRGEIPSGRTRPVRERRKPDRYGHNICEEIQTGSPGPWEVEHSPRAAGMEVEYSKSHGVLEVEYSNNQGPLPATHTRSVGSVEELVVSAESKTEQKLQWISDSTQDQLRKNALHVGGDQWRCRICGFHGTKAGTQIHVKQHYIQMFCPCRLVRTNRDTVRDHQRSHQAAGRCGHGSRVGQIYQVDHSSYHQWAETVGWDEPPPFPDCKPVLTGWRQFQKGTSASRRNERRAAQRREEKRMKVVGPPTPTVRGVPASSPSSMITMLPKVPSKEYVDIDIFTRWEPGAEEVEYSPVSSPEVEYSAVSVPQAQAGEVEYSPLVPMPDRKGYPTETTRGSTMQQRKGVDQTQTFPVGIVTGEGETYRARVRRMDYKWAMIGAKASNEGGCVMEQLVPPL